MDTRNLSRQCLQPRLHERCQARPLCVLGQRVKSRPDDRSHGGRHGACKSQKGINTTNLSSECLCIYTRKTSFFSRGDNHCVESCKKQVRRVDSISANILNCIVFQHMNRATTGTHHEQESIERNHHPLPRHSSIRYTVFGRASLCHAVPLGILPVARICL